MGEITYSFEEEIVKMGDPNYSLILVGEERYNKMTSLINNLLEENKKLKEMNTQNKNLIEEHYKLKHEKQIFKSLLKSSFMDRFCYKKDMRKNTFIVSPCIEECYELCSSPKYHEATYFRTIGSAIYEAANDTIIYVMPGTYYEHLTIDKDISIIGIDKNGDIPENKSKYGIDEKLIYATIIGNVKATVKINNCSVKFKRIKIKNTSLFNLAISACDWSGEMEECSITASATGKDANGNVIRLEENSDVISCIAFYNYYCKKYTCELKIISCNLNDSKHGTAIFSTNNVNIKKCQIQNNDLGINIKGCCKNYVIECDINNNRCGLMHFGSKNMYLQNCIIQNNFSYGVHIENDNFLSGNTFLNNKNNYVEGWGQNGYFK